MGALSISEAADETGKSRSTVWRAIKKGHLSATRDEEGEYRIDPAELARAFPPETVRSVAEKRDETPSVDTETAVLRAKLDAAERLEAELRRQLADTQEQRNKWQQQAERLALAPPRQVEPTPSEPSRPGLLRRLFG